MSQKANKTLIGAFVLGALFLVAIAVAVIGAGGLLTSPMRCVMFFDSSLRGLTSGSLVSFRGVPIGRVADIRMTGSVETMQFDIPVYVDLSTSQSQRNPLLEAYDKPKALQEMFNKGLRARLNNQSLLTGQLMIEMDFYSGVDASETPIKLATFEGYPIIPTIPSQFDSIWQRIAALPIDKIADNLLTISERISEIIELPGLGTLPGNLNETLEDARGTMSAMSNTLNTLNSSLQSAETLAGTLNRVAESVEQGAPDELRRLRAMIESYTRLSGKLERSLGNLEAVIGPNTITVIEINRAARDFSDAAKAVRSLASMLEREPEALLKGKGDKR